MQPTTASKRRNMQAVKCRDTKPERFARRELHRAGFRFQLHRRDLPGTPDIVLPRFRLVVWVHGCFWHGHTCAKGQRRPRTNSEFWAEKLDANVRRDRANVDAVTAAGWGARVLWECSLNEDCSSLIQELRQRRVRGAS
jgi:DNA mismatch endonuclease (patch repair protein)